jgi:tetraacyldisaccharide 4'-kinase
MKTPSHWQSKNLLARALFLPSCLYALATWCRLRLIKPRKVNIPVICIGNLTAGGSGKTPTAVSIARLLKQQGKTPCFLSRGYGGRLQNVVVEATRHSAADVGDEPLILANEAMVVVNHNRYEGALLAQQNGADIIIMDDGFQNPSLYKDTSFLVIEGQTGMGNLYPIPAGPMREFLSQGLKRAQAVILLGEDKTNITSKLGNLPIFKGNVTPLPPQASTTDVLAFAGIGHPQKFYASLRQCGLNPVKTVDFPDHHFYTRAELQELITEAQACKIDIFTTSKDMVKIPADMRASFHVLEIGINWQDITALTRFLCR